jgi:hypothetical protein
MVTTAVVIAQMNAMTASTVPEVGSRISRDIMQVPVETVQQRVDAAEADTAELMTSNVTEEQADETAQNQGDDHDDEAATVLEQAADAIAEVPELIAPETVQPRRSVRIAQGVAQPERYLLLTKIQNTTQELVTDKEQAKFNVIQKEILQIFEELKAVMPVMKSEVPQDAEILRCFIFFGRKVFCKWKIREN